MKLHAVFFTMLILGGFTMAYAHPDPVGVIVKNPNGMILFTSELGAIVDDDKNIELFSTQWVYQNFIMILASVIVAIMMPVSILSYKEELKSLIQTKF